MFKFLITAAIIYFIYRYITKSQKPLQRPPDEEPLPDREPEKRRADDDYIDYEELN